jgi:hypothetical protein
MQRELCELKGKVKIVGNAGLGKKSPTGTGKPQRYPSLEVKRLLSTCNKLFHRHFSAIQVGTASLDEVCALCE